MTKLLIWLVIDAAILVACVVTARRIGREWRLLRNEWKSRARND